jgi:hypothetical protein
MNEELETYKKNKTTELQKIYVENMNLLYSNFINNIKLAYSLRVRNKQSIINSLISNYNKNVIQMKNKLSYDINYIKNYNPIFNVSANNKKALLIGINYTNTLYELTGCVDDTTRMKEILTKFGFNSFTILTDSRDVKPTKEAILRELKNMIDKSSAGDLLVFYFSGHGSYTYDKNGDESDNKDEMIISSDLQGVIDDEIKQILTTMKSGVTLFGLFDSCHSGTMFDLKFNYTDNNNYSETTDNDKASECNGNVIMISGCMDNQTSSEANINGKIEGAITWSFIESIKLSETENKYNELSWRLLVKSMRDVLKKEGFDQLPQLSTDTFYDIDSKVFL